MSERDLYLTEEVLGLCWHIGNITCSKCKKAVKDRRKSIWETRIKFNSPEGFFLLWNHCIKQDWWEGFLIFLHDHEWYVSSTLEFEFIQRLINPERYADAIYEYKKGERK